jgi:signal transduction histidine kinase
VGAAVLVVGIALAGASALLVVGLRASEMNGVDRALRIEAASVANFARSGSLPRPIRSSGGQTTLIQVVNAVGSVLASSPTLAGEDAIETFTPRGSAVAIQTLSDLPFAAGGPYRIAALRVVTPSGPETIYVGESLVAINRSIGDLVTGLFVFDPLLVCIVGLTVWWLVGRALAPVEAIRAEVAEISSSALNRRVAEPTVKDEIGRLAVTMNDMLARLDSTNRRQKRFVADASHELRSPLAAAQTQLEVAQAHPDAQVWSETARSALGDLERVRRIVDDLVILVQIDEGVVPRPAVEVDLDDVVLEECARIRRTTSKTIDTSNVSGARVVGDKERLGRAVRNLLDNAVQHAHGHVEVALSQEPSSVWLRVSDDGVGIAFEDRARIFHRFTRVDDGRERREGGSGLGLAIVEEITSDHGGTVRVEGDGPGACFVVSLPSTSAGGGSVLLGRPDLEEPILQQPHTSCDPRSDATS